LKYQKEIAEALEVGTERSLYKPLGNFLEDFIKDNFQKKISTIAEQSSKNYAKKVGFPDIAIKEESFTLGYIEVKLPKDSLDDKKFKPQFSKYKNSLENIIFTNLKNWQLFQWDKESKSKKVLEVIFDFENQDLESLKKLFDRFLSFQVRQATSSEELATNLAKKTQLLAEVLKILLEEKNEDLLNTRDGFKKSLLNDISDSSFANLLAETFAYSLFIASLQHFESGKTDDLTLSTAIDYIPNNIPILDDLYSFAQKLSRQSDEVKLVAELILKELNLADIEKIQASFYKHSENDPILHFYEPFLKAYDPQTKKERGAFYTPKPVVDFIVRETHNILENDFQLENGIGNSGVKILDPATGTGTFLHSLIEFLKKETDRKFGNVGLAEEKFQKLVDNHIFKNFYGFELMVAPYTIAHLKLSILLKYFGIENSERFLIYLANSLDDPSTEPNSLFGFTNITKEGKEAKKVKNLKNIIAIIGNPPYSGTSQNPSKKGKDFTWIGEKIETYKKNGDRKLDEKNPKWLQDDYVKFIRFAQHQIDKNSKGVISYIVPHGFIDNPTFRYMRKSLMDSFQKIYIINLHGNSTKKERTPKGKKDENVFDIKQGVSIIFLVKMEKKEKCRVFYGDIWGLRKKKFAQLEHRKLAKICKTEVFPKDDMFYFIPRNTELEDEYLKFWNVKDIFAISSVGIVTGDDKRFIQDRKEDFGNELTDFTKMKKISYRPFDEKLIYFDTKLIERARIKVMQNMLDGENLGLITRRQAPADYSYKYVFITNHFLADGFIRSDNKGSESLFPLYRSEDKSESSLFETEKTPNFTEKFNQFRKKHFPNKTPENIFYYIYALLFSPTFREKYREFLQTDFPRIDFSHDFDKFSKLGKELVELHLLKHKIFNQTELWNIKKVGSDLVISFSRKSDMFKDNKIFLNPKTHIETISDEVWHFQIGGYQVLDKYLSDRKDSEIDIFHYMQIIISIHETLEIMKKLKF